MAPVLCARILNLRSSYRRARGSKCVNVTNRVPCPPSCRARLAGHNDILPTTVPSLRGVDGSWSALTLHRHQRYKVHDLQCAPRWPTYNRPSGTSVHFCFSRMNTAGTRFTNLLGRAPQTEAPGPP